MNSLRIRCPAKINAFLAVTGRRADGFHDLVSLVLPLDWGDDLEVRTVSGGTEGVRIDCTDPEVPTGPGNLIWKAADAFNRLTGLRQQYRFDVTKRIPMGAGLGGGSSDAAGALMAMNRLAGEPLDEAALWDLAAGLGSDCPLFLNGGPVVMRGRGERVEAVSEEFRRSLRDRKVILFKPAFSIATAWAYGELARRAPGGYMEVGRAEDRIRAILADAGRLRELGFNSFEPAVAGKFPAIPLLLGRLRDQGSGYVSMSGSGSACFAIGDESSDFDPVRHTIEQCWGRDGVLKVAGFQLCRTESDHLGTDRDGLA
ncbi:MAG: 4-(cytidine 5'-diphospho)-2-C-methyl-D-erythritol kinase [Opitutaceae bacterium]